MINSLDWLAQRAQVSPQKIALIFEDQRLTYNELNNRVVTMAAQLAAAGIEAGLHVAMLMPNRVETVCLVHALARLGAVLIPLNIRLTGGELRWQAGQTDCSFIICAAETETQAVALQQTGRRVISVDLPQPSGVETLYDFRGQAGEWYSRPLDVAAVQGIIFTSGTTGRPKGAMLTFANHQASAVASAFRLGTDPSDRWLACMPLYHVGGLAILFRCCLYGTTMVLQHGFDLVAVSRALETQRITLVSLVPTMLHRLLEANRLVLDSHRSKLRCILLGGGAATPSLLERSRALNLPVVTTYGLTEAASQVVTESPVEREPKAGSVGKPLMFSKVRIVDDQGQTLAPGEVGEIVISGPTVMKGYYKNLEATQKAVRNGELYSGDMGYVDGDGDLRVVQRRSDLIVSGECLSGRNRADNAGAS
jgi:O-succinylbenzoic acid--CoA ligase